MALVKPPVSATYRAGWPQHGVVVGAGDIEIEHGVQSRNSHRSSWIPLPWPDIHAFSNRGEFLRWFRELGWIHRQGFLRASLVLRAKGIWT